ncbi:hypothetical protein [Nocardia camponoti]|uniref:Uncharacterized protein n=1 Tax=Nocardia camponoti TaxID=1616106 RepID=A0A917QA86_9NOCA|nr:hypothetical protein [Nocardia camponoti]GGK38580.1 hypothetical protein GCM10011591_07890 [Nocardia camponoti]
MGFVIGMAAVVGFFVMVDRAGVWAEKRGWVHWRKTGGGGGGAGLFNAAQELITPSTAHTIAEQHRLKTTRLTHTADGQPQFSIEAPCGTVRFAGPTQG